MPFGSGTDSPPAFVNVSIPHCHALWLRGGLSCGVELVEQADQVLPIDGLGDEVIGGRRLRAVDILRLNVPRHDQGCWVRSSLFCRFFM